MSRATKLIAVAILAASWAVIAGGCVTVGYDLINKRVTVTVEPDTKGYKK